jgi:nitroimidazol reductase NimA-like FMN-containing flavoprotein (pyridoxamine 5'-phosphate oxidase superfamily)
MSQIELSYEELEQDITAEIHKYTRGYLATSDGKSVYVRSMMIVSDGLTIWFLTDKKTRKCRHIEVNPNVAVAIGESLHFEGQAKLKTHPMDEENSDFIKAFQNQHPEIYERSLRPNRVLQRTDTIVIEVSPRRIALNIWTPQFDQEGMMPYIDILNVAKKEAHRISGITDVTEFYTTPAYLV